MASRFVEIKDWDTAYKYSQAGLLINHDGRFGSFWVCPDVWKHREGRYGILVEEDENQSANEGDNPTNSE